MNTIKFWRIFWAVFCIAFFIFAASGIAFVWWYNNGCGITELCVGFGFYIVISFFGWLFIDRSIKEEK